jgi:hypothetical protein
MKKYSGKTVNVLGEIQHLLCQSPNVYAVNV